MVLKATNWVHVFYRAPPRQPTELSSRVLSIRQPLYLEYCGGRDRAQRGRESRRGGRL